MSFYYLYDLKKQKTLNEAISDVKQKLDIERQALEKLKAQG